MNGIKFVVVTDKSIRLLVKNQYTSNVESGSTRTEIKHWVELFFGVKVIAMNRMLVPHGATKIKKKIIPRSNPWIHVRGTNQGEIMVSKLP
ncbi:hypothetical protein V6Z12_D01G159900 [Gossypium hirsutum]